MRLTPLGKGWFLLVVLMGGWVGCAVPPPGPITPTNAPPQLESFIFPNMPREVFLNKSIYSFPGASVSFRDPEANLSQLILYFQQGSTSSSLVAQVAPGYTSGTLFLKGFVRNSGSPELHAFSPGTVTVSVQAVDRAGARSNLITRTFVLL